MAISFKQHRRPDPQQLHILILIATELFTVKSILPFLRSCYFMNGFCLLDVLILQIAEFLFQKVVSLLHWPQDNIVSNGVSLVWLYLASCLRGKSLAKSFVAKALWGWAIPSVFSLKLLIYIMALFYRCISRLYFAACFL